MKRILKWLGVAAGGVVVILALIALVASARGRAALATTYDLGVSGLLASVPTDSVSIAEGEHLSRIHGCRFCHGEDLAGDTVADTPPFLAIATNLTSGDGGVGGTFSVADWDRAIRHGVRPSGRGIIPLMPAGVAYNNMKDADAAKLIAFLSEVPPVDKPLPPSKLRFLGQVLVGLGMLDLDTEINLEPARATGPERAASVDYGEYLAGITCQACHGSDFRGGVAMEPGVPAPPGLTTVGAWPASAFERAVRQGVAPDGRQYNPAMPSEAFAHMTDDEIAAIQAFLQSIGPGWGTGTN